MSRSVKKGPYVDEKLLKKVDAQKSKGGDEPIRTWARACTITPEFVSHTFSVHNGKDFVLAVTFPAFGHVLSGFQFACSVVVTVATLNGLKAFLMFILHIGQILMTIGTVQITVDGSPVGLFVHEERDLIAMHFFGESVV